MHKVVIILCLLISCGDVYGFKSKEAARKIASARVVAQKVQQIKEQKEQAEKIRRDLIRRKRKALVSEKTRRFSR